MTGVRDDVAVAVSVGVVVDVAVAVWVWVGENVGDGDDVAVAVAVTVAVDVGMTIVLERSDHEPFTPPERATASPGRIAFGCVSARISFGLALGTGVKAPEWIVASGVGLPRST